MNKQTTKNYIKNKVPLAAVSRRRLILSGGIAIGE
jgi:hypothetical protein